MKIIRYFILFIFDLLDKYIQRKNILSFLKKSKLPINCFVDVGSHKGTYTDLIIKNFNCNKIYMFEPQIKIFNYIKKKYYKIKFLKIFHIAASNVDGYKDLYLNHHDLTASFTELNQNSLYLKFKAILFQTALSKMYFMKSKVKTIKLENFIKKNYIKKIDLIKIDTEGHELEVLQGLRTEIKKIKLILIEFHNNKIYKKTNEQKVHQYLLTNKFKLKKKIKFPFAGFEDRFYINKRNNI